jgi:hypothetical protein
MRNVLRITTEGKIRPVRRRAIESIPAVGDLASLPSAGWPDRPDPSRDSLGLAGCRGGAGGRGQEKGTFYFSVDLRAVEEEQLRA